LQVPPEATQARAKKKLTKMTSHPPKKEQPFWVKCCPGLAKKDKQEDNQSLPASQVTPKKVLHINQIKKKKKKKKPFRFTHPKIRQDGHGQEMEEVPRRGGDEAPPIPTRDISEMETPK
jgi:hypothetical protein